MADEQTNEVGGEANGQDAQPVQPQMRILAQYIRDVSFENILAQKGLGADVKPDVQVQVSLDAKKRGDNRYEVVSKFNVTSRSQDKEHTLFVLELEYCGIFQIEGVPEQQLHPYLLIECPRMLFPYVRRIVSDLTHDGGFPPLNLENIDFISIYRQSLAQRQAAAQGGGAQTAS